jgi:hypothetical protein
VDRENVGIIRSPVRATILPDPVVVAAEPDAAARQPTTGPATIETDLCGKYRVCVSSGVNARALRRVLDVLERLGMTVSACRLRQTAGEGPLPLAIADGRRSWNLGPAVWLTSSTESIGAIRATPFVRNVQDSWPTLQFLRVFRQHMTACSPSSRRCEQPDYAEWNRRMPARRPADSPRQRIAPEPFGIVRRGHKPPK